MLQTAVTTADQLSKTLSYFHLLTTKGQTNNVAQCGAANGLLMSVSCMTKLI